MITLMGAEPDTTCPTCREAESTPLRRLVAAWRGPAAGDYIRAYGAVLMAATGRTWYERHRDAYATTGDDKELARMLRHVGGGS